MTLKFSNFDFMKFIAKKYHPFIVIISIIFYSLTMNYYWRTNFYLNKGCHKIGIF